MKIIWSGIIIENKRILLIKRKFNKKAFSNYWAPAWWGQEENETFEETAIREVKEEVWLDFIPTRLFIEEHTENTSLYRYLWDFSWKIDIQEEECDWYWWFTYTEAKKLLIAKNIEEIIDKLYEENLI